MRPCLLVSVCVNSVCAFCGSGSVLKVESAILIQNTFSQIQLFAPLTVCSVCVLKKIIKKNRWKQTCCFRSLEGRGVI